MLGTIVNAAAVIVGGLVGLIVRNNLPDRYKEVVTQVIGMSVLFIGLTSSLSKLILPDMNPILFIISLIIGTIIGEKLGIEDKLESLGDTLQKKMGSAGDSFSNAFVSASLLFCVGTMAILGSLESGIHGRHDILYAKSVLDGVTSIIFASSMGFGVMFSAVSVFVYQGSITMLARVIAPYLTTAMTDQMSIVGGVMITGLAFRTLGIKHMKVGNMLPAMVVPVVYYLVQGLFAK